MSMGFDSSEMWQQFAEADRLASREASDAQDVFSPGEILDVAPRDPEDENLFGVEKFYAPIDPAVLDMLDAADALAQDGVDPGSELFP